MPSGDDRELGEENTLQAYHDLMQTLVLAELVRIHPARLTLAELELSLKTARQPADTAPDTIKLALDALEADGLVREVGGEYALTRPAARLSELPDV